MTKPKKTPKPRPHTGDSIQIELREHLDDGFVIDRNITLTSTTGVSPFGNNPNFEWEGTYGDATIKVVLPRATHERNAEVEGELPNGYHPDWGSVRDQLYDELRRILRQIN